MNTERSECWTKTLVAVTLLALGTAACGTSSDDGGDPIDDQSRSNATICADSCTAAMGAECSAEVGQPASACKEDCLAMFQSYPECEQVMRAFVDCPALLESSGWFCNTDGVSEPVESVCVEETSALQSCMS